MLIICSMRGMRMYVFIARTKQPGLFGGSIRHRPPDRD
jgi:thiamine biosynthesis protein ThiI